MGYTRTISFYAKVDLKRKEQQKYKETAIHKILFNFFFLIVTSHPIPTLSIRTLPMFRTNLLINELITDLIPGPLMPIDVQL